MHDHSIYGTLFANIRKRPGMYLMTSRLLESVSLVSGIDMATGGGLLIGFQEWLSIRRGRQGPVAWQWFVRDLLLPKSKDWETADDNDPAAVDRFFELLIEFLEKRRGPAFLEDVLKKYKKLPY